MLEHRCVICGWLWFSYRLSEWCPKCGKYESSGTSDEPEFDPPLADDADSEETE
jgi:predicted  nucleic acid-binding Zn-ribbon protein